MPPTECKEGIMKEEIYEKVTEIYDNTPRNMVRIRDFNAKTGRDLFKTSDYTALTSRAMIMVRGL